ncbi:MAG: hypothetical protein HWE20_05780 [Gammaproteobacteria bacterium]|nr:hypothetical protein [Gammaproteobacteria bacterium]
MKKLMEKLLKPVSTANRIWLSLKVKRAMRVLNQRYMESHRQRYVRYLSTLSATQSDLSALQQKSQQLTQQKLQWQRQLNQANAEPIALLAAKRALKIAAIEERKYHQSMRRLGIEIEVIEDAIEQLRPYANANRNALFQTVIDLNTVKQGSTALRAAEPDQHYP